MLITLVVDQFFCPTEEEEGVVHDIERHNFACALTFSYDLCAWVREVRHHNILSPMTVGDNGYLVLLGLLGVCGVADLLGRFCIPVQEPGDDVMYGFVHDVSIKVREWLLG